jgi:hypothetical protein
VRREALYDLGDKLIQAGFVVPVRVNDQTRTIKFERLPQLSKQGSGLGHEGLQIAAAQRVSQGSSPETLRGEAASAMDLEESTEGSYLLSHFRLAHPTEEGHVPDDADPAEEQGLHGRIPEARPPGGRLHIRVAQ